MYEKRLKGVVIPMITPMNEDSSVDDASLRNFVNFWPTPGRTRCIPTGPTVKACC